MSFQGLPDLEICELTRISISLLKQMQRTYHNTGKVALGPSTEGQPCILTAIEAKVSYLFLKAGPSLTLYKFLCNCTKCQPNTALAELQTELCEVFKLDVSLQTILWTLQWEGYTMKTVCNLFSLQ